MKTQKFRIKDLKGKTITQWTEWSETSETITRVYLGEGDEIVIKTENHIYPFDDEHFFDLLFEGTTMVGTINGQFQFEIK